MRGANSGLAARYQTVFQASLLSGETLLTANASIYVKISETLGKGMGDGTLGVTNLRLIHKGNAGGGLYVSRNDIVSVTKNWIILPGSSNLKITARKDGALISYDFYCGTGFCKDVIALLGN